MSQFFAKPTTWAALFLLLGASRSLAYPAFISYGYSTCIACHYNGQGNGPLNDYGRGLFSSEIAARGLVSSATTDEQLAASSGFLGSKPLPWWLHPGAKYRGLLFINNLGMSSAVKKYVNMQADVNVALHLDQNATKVIVLSMGYVPTPSAQRGAKDPKNKNLISREHYFRWQTSKKWFTYIGLMDKVFGIRTIDHTAYSRSATGVSMNDQSHGFMTQYYGNGWEWTGNGFLGNYLQEDSDVRQKGFSTMVEYDLADKNRVGTAILLSSNDYVQKARFEIHSKLGLQKGNSVLSEIGMIKDTPKVGEAKGSGIYAFVEGNYLIRRGYNLISQLEYYNATQDVQSPAMKRWTFGLLMFPMDRFEWRVTLVNGRTWIDTSVVPDQWMLQTQLHMSL